MAAGVLIFDLDDTLYPEMEYIRSAFRAVAEEFAPRLGLTTEAVESELNGLFAADPASSVFDRWLASRSLSAELVTSMVEVFRANEPELHLFCDSKWTLDALSGHRLALLTDGRPSSQRYKLQALGIESAFEQILVTDEIDISCRKPSPVGFQVLLERLEVEPGLAVYVGDNPLKDFRGARQVGIGTIRVRRPCGRYSSLEPPNDDCAPDAEISTLFELPGLVSGLFPGV